MPRKVQDNLASLLRIRNSTSDSADLYFYGDIVSNWLGAWDDADQYPDAVRKFLDGAKGKNLNIYINSEGGAVFAGMAIYNMLRRHEGYKTVRVDGIAASIASVIALAGDKVIVPANAYFMIHKPWTVAIGDANELLKVAEILDSVEQGIINAYAQNLAEGVDIETIKEMVNEETWLTGDEAAKYFRVEVAEPVRAVAYNGDLGKFNKLPEELETRSLADYKARLNLLKLKGAECHE